MTAANTLKAESTATLLKLLKPGFTVYTACSHVSSSGMTRHIGVYIVQRGKTRADDRIQDISWYVANILGYRRSKTGNGDLIVAGAGMDMGFHVVYALGSALWPKGTAKPHGTRNGEPDRDGGYALRQRWL